MVDALDIIDDLCHDIHQGTYKDRLRANGYDPNTVSPAKRLLMDVLVEFADLWPKDFRAKGKNHGDRLVVGAGTVRHFVTLLFPHSETLYIGGYRGKRGDPHVVVPTDYWLAVVDACEKRNIEHFAFRSCD